MSEEIPDKWCVVKINNNSDVLYKVFGCWYGGYGGSDSWRINSGIESVKEQDDCWLFEGFSGSLYKCGKNNYGTHMYGATVLSNYITKAKEEGVEMFIMDKDTDWEKLNYAITD